MRGMGKKVNRVKTDSEREAIAKEVIFLNYGYTAEELSGRSRKWELVWPRHLSMYLIRNYTKYSYESIGATYNRNHATVIQAMKSVRNITDTDKRLKQELVNLVTEYQARI